jgi:23S rRNA (pseudouridine1915-N3)-methyltransferase
VKVRVAWLGRPTASPYERAVETYRKRVHRRWPAEDRPVRASAGGRDKDPERALRLEADSLVRHLEPGWRLVALDEHGRAHTSEEFAKRLQKLADRGVEGVLFAIGSDLGLDRDLVTRADESLSLGPMTLPHLLARLLLWEQLFRAANLLSGGAYHRVSVQ